VLNNSFDVPGSASFTDVDGVNYTSDNSVGLTVTLTEMNYNTVGINGIVAGMFEGTLTDPDGNIVEITNGQFMTNWWWPIQ